MLYFYDVLFMLCASGINVKLWVQKLAAGRAFMKLTPNVLTYAWTSTPRVKNEI
jgi:hypothetical protein